MLGMAFGSQSKSFFDTLVGLHLAHRNLALSRTCWIFFANPVNSNPDRDSRASHPFAKGVFSGFRLVSLDSRMITDF